jgi:hypothetical protein
MYCMYVLMVSPRMTCVVSAFLEGKKICNSGHLYCVFNVRGVVVVFTVNIALLSLCQSKTYRCCYPYGVTRPTRNTFLYVHCKK